MVAGAEPERGVAPAFAEGLVAVVQPHDALVAVTAGVNRRVQRQPEAVEHRDEVADGDAELAERRPVGAPLGQQNPGLEPADDPAVREVVEEPRPDRLDDQGAEEAMFLAVVGEQVVVEEDGAELLIGPPSVDHAAGRSGGR